MFVEPKLPQVTETETSQAIDQYLSLLWRRFRLKRADVCADHEFVRRVSLDLIGRIATVSEVDQFLRDPAESRRSRLIDRVLDSPACATHYWSRVLLAPSRSPRVDFIEDRSTATVRMVEEAPIPVAHRASLRGWLAEQFRKQRGWDRIVSELIKAVGWNDETNGVPFILTHLGNPIPAAERRGQGHFDTVPLTAHILRLFLGMRLDPRHGDLSGDNIRRFHGTNLLCQQLECIDDRRAGKVALADDPRLNADATVIVETSAGTPVIVKAMFVDGRAFDPLRTIKVMENGVIRRRPMTRREQLAAFVISHENFAPAFAQRLWRWFFGRGLGETDDLDELGPRHKLLCPELLDRLAKDFVLSGHQPRFLMRSICNSRAYQLSSVADAANDGLFVPTLPPRVREPYFSRMALKMMTPDQFLESLCTCTVDRPDCKLSDQERKTLRERLADEVEEVSVYMFDGCARTDLALWLMNSRVVNDIIAATVPDSVEDVGKTAEALYLATLNRRPEKEIRQLQHDVRPVLVKEKNPLAPAQDLLWALINSSEFILNH